MVATPSRSATRAPRRSNGPWNVARALGGSRVSSPGTGRHAMSKPYIKVAAGLILDAHGRLLLGQRPEGKPWAGWWELPGGKIEPGESIEQALVRELDEELGIQATQIYPWVTHIHEYPKNIVELAFCQVTAWT